MADLRVVQRLGLVALLAALASGAEARVQFIELGWDIPDTAFLAKHWQQMEQESPFDGVIFRFETDAPDGQKVSSEAVWSARRWQREWLDQAIADLKSCHFTKFRHNFVRFNATPDRLAWDDDEAWSALCQKAALCAALTREGGAAGLAPDFEPYGANQWQWDAESGVSFEQTANQARARGRQFISAVASEMPDAVILTLFTNSWLAKAGLAPNPNAVLWAEHYGLLPAFWDGMIGGATDQMVLVDGCEGGYYMDSEAAFQDAALGMRRWQGPSMNLVSPENRAKARAQCQAGFGIYLDMYINPPGNVFYRPELDGSRLKRLLRNTRAARDSADEYVWIYGEQCRWWSGLAEAGPWRAESLAKTAGQGRSWEELLPGVTRGLDRLRDAESAVAAELAAGGLVNQAPNGDFAEPPQAAGGLPPGWEAWQDKPLGVFAHDAEVAGGAVRAVKVKWGCLLSQVKAEPGQTWYVSGRCRQEGAGWPKVSVRWQSADEKWASEADDRSFAFGLPGDDGWMRAGGSVVVPPEVGYLLVLLDVRGQEADTDRLWFDDIELYRLSD